MRVHYLKMHGAGNRIVVVDRRHDNLSPPDVDTLQMLADESSGPGFDQLMWVTAAAKGEHVASYRVFNADGSEVEQCGNGVRCVARMLANEWPDKRSLLLESPAGLVEARILGAGLFSISMGAPEFDPASIPFVADKAAPRYRLDVDGQPYDVAVLSMGNPHCVLEVDNVNEAPVARLGPLIEHHERFPQRTNVGFMAVVDRRTIDLRVHERGVGETLACGTGACAAAVAGSRLGLLDDEITVRLPGGQLVVSWRGGTDPVWLTGNAELISEGSMDL